MKTTTSRDPSAKTRRFAKALASFLSRPYANRGKQSLGENETWLVVVEDHGNPSGLVKRCGDEEELLCFTLSLEPAPGRPKKLAPLVTGAREDALPISSGQIDFIDEGEVKFRLKI